MYNRELAEAFLRENSYKVYVDKKELQNFLSCSEKTSERLLNRLGFVHMRTHLIEMMKDLEKGYSPTEAAVKYNCSLENVNAFIKRHAVEVPNRYRTRNYSDVRYFQNIDSEVKAYILGFIAADGHVGDKEIRISLKREDRKILERIRLEVGINLTVRDVQTRCSFNDKISDLSLLSFGTREIISDLRALGLLRNKTASLKFPDIPEEFYIPFIRGYVDGDGSFTLDKNGRLSFSVEGTEDFLKSLQSYLEANHDIKFNSKLRKRFNTPSCCYTLKASGNTNVKNLLHLLYKNSTIYLERKFSKYLRITNKRDQEPSTPELYPSGSRGQ